MERAAARRFGFGLAFVTLGAHASIAACGDSSETPPFSPGDAAIDISTAPVRCGPTECQARVVGSVTLPACCAANGCGLDVSSIASDFKLKAGCLAVAPSASIDTQCKSLAINASIPGAPSQL